MDVVTDVVMMDMILMETHMVQIMVQHMQRGVHIPHTVIVVIVMALPLVIHLVIVVIHKHDFSLYISLRNTY